jgi:hypothetical protein
MKNFYTALKSHFDKTTDGAHNTFYNAIGGRFYNSVAPSGAVLPYCVYSHVASSPADTFTEGMDEILIQFSIFSANESAVEVHDAMTALKALFDDCIFTITSATLVSFKRGSEGLEPDEFDAAGTQKGWHYHVDYTAMIKR